MHVKDFMHTSLTTVPPDALVRTAHQLMTMRQAPIRHLPVVDASGRLVGILTDRDIRRAGASSAPSMAPYELQYLLDKLHVRDAMVSEVVTVDGTLSLAEAGAILLERKVGCLPVVGDDGRLKGLCTVTDFLRVYTAQPDAGHPLLVAEMMHTPALTAPPTMGLAEVQRLMLAQHIRHVPVVAGTHLVGIITDRDLRQACPSPATSLSRGEIAYHMETTPIATCMTKDVRWTHPGAEMPQVARQLVQGRIGCLPVLQDHRLVGMVTALDCLRAFLRTTRTA